MPSKVSLNWPLFINCVVGIVISSIIMYFFNLDLFAQGSYVPAASPVSIQALPNMVSGQSVSKSNVTVTAATSAGLPKRLKIPKIKVNAVLEPVGLTSAGAVDVPKGPTNAAWFKLGPRPGETGSAVITGHYGVWRSGLPTVFNKLTKLKKGDKLSVIDEKGATTKFVVREVKNYGPKESAPEVFISNDGKAHLNLITCVGVWNKVTKSYPKRLVVFADKE